MVQRLYGVNRKRIIIKPTFVFLTQYFNTIININTANLLKHSLAKCVAYYNNINNHPKCIDGYIDG